MIITVEGISCSGKTTLTRALLKSFPNAIAVGRLHENNALNECSVQTQLKLPRQLLLDTYAKLREVRPNSPEEEIELARRYSPLIQDRMRDILRASQCAPTVIVDRDMWSFFVHGYAKFQGDFGSHRNIFSELFSLVALQVPIVAHLTVVLQVPYQVWKKRALKRLIQPHPTLFDINFYNELQNAYLHVVSILGEPHAIIIDGQLPTEEISIHIKRTIDKDLRHAEPDAQAILSVAAQSLTISHR